MEEEKVVVDNENTTEEEETLTPEDEVEQAENIDWKQKALELEEIAKNQKIRAEKAERLAKSAKSEKPSTSESPSMTIQDTLAIVNNKVHEDDIPEVEEYARFKGISISEALKSGVVKTLLREKEEMRKTAQATSTGKNRAGTSNVSPDALLAKARAGGEIKDPEALALARLEERKRQK